MIYKIGVLKNLAKFMGKPICWNHFLNKAAGLRPAILLKGHFSAGVSYEF